MSEQNSQHDEQVNAQDASADTSTADASQPNAAEGNEQVSELDAAIAERDKFKTSLQLLQADFENYRKRVIKQQNEATARANESLVQKMLPVLDTIDLAMAHDPSKSLEQVASSLRDVLEKEGLERIASKDVAFDPADHEAVAHEPGDGNSGPQVSEEMRAGYRWKGRTLRPAMVKVTG